MRDVTSRDHRPSPDTNREFGISFALLSWLRSLVDESLLEVCKSQWIKRFGSRSNYKVTAGVNVFLHVSSCKTIINTAMWHFQGQDQGQLFRSFFWQENLFVLSGYQIPKSWFGILVLAICVASSSNKTPIHLYTFFKCAKNILTRAGFEPTPPVLA